MEFRVVRRKLLSSICLPETKFYRFRTCFRFFISLAYKLPKNTFNFHFLCHRKRFVSPHRSGCRESNPGLTHPMGKYYRYTTARHLNSECRESNSDLMLPKHVYCHYTTLRFYARMAGNRSLLSVRHCSPRSRLYLTR